MTIIANNEKLEDLLIGIQRALASLDTVSTNEYLCTKRAARYLGVSPELLEHYRYEGGGPAFSKLSHIVRYRKSDLDAFMTSRLKKHTAEV